MLHEVRDLKRTYETIYNKGLWLHPFLAPSERVKLKVLLGWLNPKISDVVLDLGCGSGRYLLRATGPSLGAWIGLDIAIKPLKTIKRIMPDASVVCADACHLPFRGGTFDKISCIDALEHIPNDHQALREATKTLKEGGLALFYVPCGNPLNLEWLVSKVSKTKIFPRDKEQRHLHRYKTDEIVSLLRICSSDVLKITYFLHYFSSLFDLLGSWYERKSMKGKRPHIPKLFLELIFFIERVEYKVLHRFSFAAGMFILCKKSDAEPMIRSFTTSNAPYSAR